MAVKAIGNIYTVSLLDTGEFSVFLSISSNNDVNGNVNAGTFAGNAVASTVNVQLIAFIKSYAIANMGATFDFGDTARLVTGVDLL